MYENYICTKTTSRPLYFTEMAYFRTKFWFWKMVIRIYRLIASFWAGILSMGHFISTLIILQNFSTLNHRWKLIIYSYNCNKVTKLCFVFLPDYPHVRFFSVRSLFSNRSFRFRYAGLPRFTAPLQRVGQALCQPRYTMRRRTTCLQYRTCALW